MLTKKSSKSGNEGEKKKSSSSLPFGWGAKGEEFEVRVIVYEIKGWSAPADEEAGLTDMYVRCKLGETTKWENTDTHLQATNKASYNFRFNFRIRLPDEDGQSNKLYLQVYDWDTLGDTLLAMGEVDVKSFLTLAERYGAPLQFFHRKIDREVLRAADEARQRKEQAIQEAEAKAAEAAEESGLLSGGAGGFLKGAYGAAGGLAQGVGSVAGGVAGATLDAGAAVGSVTVGAVGGVVGGVASIGSRKKKRKPTMWENIKKNVGLGPLPPHASWVPLKQARPRKDGSTAYVTVGQVLLSVEAMPKAVAKELPAGWGRGDPNQNPVLPPPEGRPDYTKMLDPLFVFKECIGNGLITKFSALIIFLGVTYLFFFTFPAMFGLIQLCLDLPDGGYILLGLCLCSCFCCCMAIQQTAATCGCFEKSDDDDEDDSV